MCLCASVLDTNEEVKDKSLLRVRLYSAAEITRDDLHFEIVASETGGPQE